MTRRIATIGLLGYAAVLVLAAWPTPLRPGLLELPHAAAVRLLRVPGWFAGQDVFIIPEVVTEAPRAFCTYVKAHGSADAELLLRPAGGRCRWSGLRWHTTGLEISEAKFFASLYNSRKWLTGTPQEVKFLGGLGAFYCHRARTQGFDARAVRLIHYAYMGAYADGSTRPVPIVHYEWRCAERQPRHVRYGATEPETERFWGRGSPWP